MKFRHRGVVLWLALLLAACGCANPRSSAAASGYIALEPWSYQGSEGVRVITDHYVIHSTIADRQTVRALASVMEGALRQYQQFTPGLRISARPMECFVFARRSEWAQFTRDKTGADATIYLQINRGGYTVNDWYVAYFIGDVGTYAVAAHEGWHQFVARNFKARIPPFLEEGIATMFESILWSADQPQWQLGRNRTRAEKLGRAMEQQGLWSLEQLITMHAGDVVNLTSEQIETFYAQGWAFALFLWDADEQRLRPMLQRMLCDLAMGNEPAGITFRKTGTQLWDPTSAKPLLEHYLGLSIDQLQREYDAYVRRLAAERRYEP